MDDKNDPRTIIYNVYNGSVSGGSEMNWCGRQVKHITRKNSFYPACIYKMELDLLNRIFVMECDDERIILDSKIGDFDFSPIVMFESGPAQITLL